MSVHAFTSFTYSYLDRARVLANTIKRQHPDWKLWAVLTDKEPDGFSFDMSKKDFDEVLTAEQLYGKDFEPWLFGHDIVEACTAVKGAAALHILGQPSCKKLVYFDPDIAIFNSLDDIIELLDDFSIILTPHQVDPEPLAARRAIRDNEITSLDFGVFNLGFIAIMNDNEGKRFATWWRDRLNEWCHDRRDIGVFVDQKWCELIPCFFDRVKVLRDPGYNVASWNLSQRKLSYDEQGCLLVNGHKLRFYHFTKLGPVGDMMTQRYAQSNIEVYELWWWYRQQVRKFGVPEIPKNWWYYDSFDNEVKIPKVARELYRDRADLRKAFVSPFVAEDGYYQWLCHEGIIKR